MTMDNLKAIAILFVMLGTVVLIGCLGATPETPPGGGEFKKFASGQELSTFLKEKSENMPYGGFGGAFATAASGAFRSGAAAPSAAEGAADTSKAGSEDYSTTNVQVQGVDEADIVKNDGKYAYILSTSNKSVIIVDAWPAENGQIVSQIPIDGNPSEIFINGDRLVVLGSSGYYWACRGGICPLMESSIAPDYEYTPPKAYVLVYDITDRANPVLKNNITLDGDYQNARMIGDYAYIVVDSGTGYYDGNYTLPNLTRNGVTTTVQPEEIYYFDIIDYSYRFTTILGVNVKDDASKPGRKTLLTGYSQEMYVSQNKMYLTYQKMVNYFDYMGEIVNAFRPYMPADVAGKIDIVMASGRGKSDKWTEIGEIMSNWTRDISYDQWQTIEEATAPLFYQIQLKMHKESDKTLIFSFTLNNGQVDLSANGEVPGYPLNQFSMDEYNGYFRIATTTTDMPAAWSEFRAATTRNNVYVLDWNLAIVGRLENLAPGESIYSARFMGDRAYLVTFRRIDPLFVIDVSNPASPQVLGQLKIPGFSEYLHPYDETHIIGVGKDVPEVAEGQRAIPEGVKLALFDVSDVANPKEVSKYVIGGQGTYSEALDDHRAFLFNKEKELLVIPINDWGAWWGTRQKEAANGAYVFKLTIENGFELRGNISHMDSDYWGNNVRRSFYIDNVLYTLSEGLLKANSLSDLSELKAIELPTMVYKDVVY